ncbi:hypothetical protein NDU88_009741 [Pleurodeles waltl]|uniref:Uncharacterized protein n=1 Tax=Pleurodeles waltl TaxID=8319 RepID=A0AAV7QVH5_PLEWA|nr:hypothetical protein NDU88_009741 [Pleurodeles waltl]
MTRETQSQENKWSQTRKSAHMRVAKQRDRQTVFPPTQGRAPVMTRETRLRENKWSQTRKSAHMRVAKQRVRVSGSELIVNYT